MRHHVLLALGSGVTGAVVVATLDSGDPWFLVSMATAYAALALLALTLGLGPWNVLLGRSNPVSTDVRRDAGIWCALLGLVHVGAGLGVHQRGRPWLYFIPEPDRWTYLPVRTDLFGFANYTGLGAALLLVLLLALSSDRALRRLGTRRWKSLQRWNYGVALLVVVHAAAYLWLEGRNLIVVAAFGLVVGAVAALQWLGTRRVRRGAGRRRNEAADPADTAGF